MNESKLDSARPSLRSRSGQWTGRLGTAFPSARPLSDSSLRVEGLTVCLSSCEGVCV